MDSYARRLIDELTRRLDALASAFQQSQRPKQTSWVQNGSGGGAKYAARLMASWASTSVAAQIYILDGDDVIYKETATVYDPLSTFAALDVNDWMYCTLQAGKYYGADPGGCPGTCPLIADPPATQP